ncbi:MAG: hypothetical protein WC197_08725 [Candidatus Gastranaerophilaceae bacterium]|jgi:hypothetical protein
MLRNKKTGVSLVIVILSIVILLVAAGLVIDIGIVLNAQEELQKQVETTALFGATVLEPKRTASGLTIDTTDVNNYIKEIFNLSKSQIITSTLADADIHINAQSKAVALKATGYVQTYFLNLTGINTVRIDAQAAALSSPFYLSPDFPIKPTKGSILTFSEGETYARRPFGSLNQSLGLDLSENLIISYLYGPPDSKVASLGPGGYVMVRLPVPLIDGDGADLYIRELGNMKGYFIFAGNDVDPTDPYVDEANQGAGIKWTNISCTGTPEGSDINTALGAYYVDVSLLDGTTVNQAKFYGSGYFDIGATCTKNGSTTYNKDIVAARYLKIIDDNEEDGFIADNPVVPVALYGEHSSVTPGANIDAVAVLHHARLIKYSDFNTIDSNGLIHVLNNILGIIPAGSTDTDGDGITDDLEYDGWFYDGGTPPTPTSIIDNTSPHPQVYLTSPIVNDINISKKPLHYY